MPHGPKISRALLSVSDKSGLVELAHALHEAGVALISTGGTKAALAAAGLPVTDVSAVTGLPEMMDGRVKTLHPAVHGGLLAVRDDAAHMAEAKEHNIAPIDLLVVNLYPFEETVLAGADEPRTIENIDVGGPAMIRAASKNHASVTVVVDPADYARVLAEMAANAGATSRELRRRLAAKAFARTAAYDTAIATWFADAVGEATPVWRSFAGRLAMPLRYGENPHQQAALYRTLEARPGVVSAVQVQGKELSYNNIADTDAAIELASELSGHGGVAVAIIKHANPCGAAVAPTLLEAYAAALRCDPVSAFGGIVATSAVIDGAAAREITKRFTEVVIAPGATDEAKAIFAAKTGLRLLTTGGVLPDARAPGLTVRSVAGGLLVQSRDNAVTADLDLTVVTERAPTAAELDDLKLAFTVAKHVKSNAIVYVKGHATVGIGAGQMSRLDSARVAAWKAAEAGGSGPPLTQGSVAASDAFFPFADGLAVVADAGATAVIQPGGSIRDDEVIKAANDRGLAMVLTGRRHFRH